MSVIKLIVATNNYPSESRNESSIVKSYVDMHRRLFPEDEVEVVLLKADGGFKSYLGRYLQLFKKSSRNKIILIHFGGMYAFSAAVLARLKGGKIVIVFHGTDIHAAVPPGSGTAKRLKIKLNQLCSFLTIPLAKRAEFVSDSMVSYVPALFKRLYGTRLYHHQLSVNYQLFTPGDRVAARNKLGLENGKKYFLFFNNNKSNIKRPDIANAIVNTLGLEYRLLEVSNIPFETLPVYYSAADYLLVTSDNEGSPNVVREALVMNLPVISRDVGDVKDYLSAFRSCLIIPEEPVKAAGLIKDHIRSLAGKDRENIRELLKDKLELEGYVKKYRKDLASLIDRSIKG